MRRYYYYAVCLFLAFGTVSCGTGLYNNNPNNVGLYGNWNVVMYPTNDSNPAYVFGLAMSQEGNTTYSGASIAYNGGIAAPSNMCINPNALRATATVNNQSTYTMTITDTTTNTVISVTGSMPAQTTTVSGNYSTVASQACPQSQGTMTMTPQP